MRENFESLKRHFEWLPYWGKRWQAARLAKAWADAVEAEVVVDNIGEARWVAVQSDGRFRYIRANPFFWHNDIGMTKKEFVQNILTQAGLQWKKRK